MELIIQAITVFFDYLLKPFGFFPPYVGLCFTSAVTGVLFLKLFGIFSNQTKIRKTKDQIKAHLLGIVLYRDDVRISFKMQAKMLAANLRYLKCSLWPLFVLVILCIPILGQLNIRYGYRPFGVGEKIKMFVHVDEDSVMNSVSLKTGGGIQILTPPLRIKDLGEVDWKLKALSPGKHAIEISASGKTYNKEIIVGTSAQKIVPFSSKSFVSSIIYPGDRTIPKESELNSIKIDYPDGYVWVFGHNTHWLVMFCVVSILSGLLFKRLLKVEM